MLSLKQAEQSAWGVTASGGSEQIQVKTAPAWLQASLTGTVEQCLQSLLMSAGRAAAVAALM